MNSSSKIGKSISAITILLVVVAAVLAGIVLFSGEYSIMRFISKVISLIAMIPCFVYACKGYKKDVAVYYKAFMGLFALSALITLITDIIDTVANSYPSYFSTVICAIVLIGYLILAFAKDFGKQKSMITAFCILGAQLISFVRMLVKFGGVTSIILSACLNLIVSIVACLFVYAKYQDKAERGTK